MKLDDKYILELLVDAAMVAERLTPSDFDERYRKDMEGGYRPEVMSRPPPRSRYCNQLNPRSAGGEGRNNDHTDSLYHRR
jgi:hypothetical protein